MARNPLYSTPPPAKQSAPDQWTQRYFGGLIGKDQLPFRQLDWPNPILAKVPAPDQWTASYNWKLLGKDQLPFRQLDWPNPILRALPAPDQWSQTYNYNLYPGKDALPFRWREFPNPILAKVPAPDQWTVSYNYNLYPGTDQLPFRWREFPNPILRALPAPDQWTQSYNYNLYPGTDKLPFRQQDWPLQTAASQNQSYTQSLRLVLSTPAPFNQTDWPVTLGPRQAPQQWTGQYNVNLVGQDKLPIRQNDWPSLQAAPQNQSYIQNSRALLQPTPTYPLTTFAQYDWPLPGRPVSQDQSWTVSYNANLLIGQDRLPFRQDDWPVPPGPPWPHRAVMDRPVYLITEGLDLFFGAPGQVPEHDYPLIPQPPRADTSFIRPTFSGLFTPATPLGMPFNQYQWPSPQARFLWN